jgi:hypothetical protein
VRPSPCSTGAAAAAAMKDSLKMSDSSSRVRQISLVHIERSFSTKIERPIKKNNNNTNTTCYWWMDIILKPDKRS